MKITHKHLKNVGSNTTMWKAVVSKNGIEYEVFLEYVITPFEKSYCSAIISFSGIKIIFKYDYFKGNLKCLLKRILGVINENDIEKNTSK